MIKIAIISNPNKLSSKLTWWATHSYAYHVCFVDEDNGKMYDQNLLFRRRIWPHYNKDDIKLYHCPVEVTTADLEYWLDTSEDWYGVFDYSWFAIRKFFPTAKASFKGSICSETVNNILKYKGWTYNFESTPSPADFEKVLTPI